MSEPLTREHIAFARGLAFLNDPATAEQVAVSLCDSHELLRAQLADVTRERDEARHEARKYLFAAGPRVGGTDNMERIAATHDSPYDVLAAVEEVVKAERRAFIEHVDATVRKRAEAAEQQVARLREALLGVDAQITNAATEPGYSIWQRLGRIQDTCRQALAATDPDQRLSASDMSCTGCYSRPCICDELANREGA